MEDAGFLVSAFVFLAAAVLIVPLAKRSGLGSVLGYLVAGIVMGPFVLGLVSKPDDILHFAEFGVVMMLFLIGLELEPRMLWRLRRPILGLGGLQVVTTTAILAAIGLAAGLAWQTAVAVGLALALSSTAIALQTLEEKHLLQTGPGQSAFSVLLFQDIAVIPILAAISLLAIPELAAQAGGGKGHGGGPLDGLSGWLRALIVLGAVAGIILAGRFLIRPCMAFIAATRIREIFTAFALFLVIGIALLMQTIGLSPALGTFLAGVVLADSEYRHQLETDIEPFKGLLLGLFFISVGMSIDFGVAAASPVIVALLVLGLIAVKFAILFGLGAVFRMPLAENILFACLLAQGGEFAFVIFQFAVTEGAIPRETASLLTVVVALSMALTPLIMLVHQYLIEPRLSGPVDTADMPGVEDEGHDIIIGGFGRVGQVVARMLNAQGIGTTVLDHDPAQIEFVRRFGNKAYFGDVTRLDLLRTAGMDHARMFVVAIDDEEQAIEVTKLVKEHFPAVTVMARARNRPHAYALMKAGADIYRRETFYSAVEMGEAALRHLGFGAHRAHRAARTFARHDVDTLLESFEFYEDDKALISFSRKRRDDLEKVMEGDADTYGGNGPGGGFDAGPPDQPAKPAEGGEPR